MDLQHLFDIFMGSVMAMIGYFARQLHIDNKETAKELSAFKTHVAENYAHNNQIKNITDEIKYVREGVDEIKLMLMKNKT